VRVHNDPLYPQRAALPRDAPSILARPQRQEAADDVTARKQPTVDVQAALAVLGRLPVRPDVLRANLTSANLTEASLIGANLTGAILFHSNLTGVVLFEADLTEAQLLGTDLTGANLLKANLTKTNLYEAEPDRCEPRRCEPH
jgi:uncharacterized protein YjbI with pentapeptide repeats